MEITENYKDIEKKSAKGIKWVGIAELFIRLFQFGTTIILARILQPEDFGIIGIVLIFTQLIYVLFDFGFSTALIQKKHTDDDHFSTTFVVNMISAGIFAVLVLLSSAAISEYFRMIQLNAILKVLTIVFFFYGINAIPVVRLMKDMRFRLLSALQMVAVLGYALVTVSFVAQGAGVWSFVYGIIAEQVILTLLLLIFAWWKIRIRFNFKIFKELFSFGGNVFGMRVAAYVNANSPGFIIGKVLGAAQLGFYSIAYQLIEFPVQRIAKNVLKVMFPAFSKLQDDPDNYKILYKKTLYHLMLLTFPIFAGLAVIAPQFIRLVYGEKWIIAILPLQILTFAGLIRTLWVLNSAIFLSKGRPDIELKINLVYFAFLIPSVIIVSPSGIVNVALTVSGVMFIFWIIALFKALGLIQMKPGEIMYVFSVPMLGVVSFVLFDLFIKYRFLRDASDLFQLLVTIVVSIIIYVLIVLKFDRDILRKIMKFVIA
ncbi:MAG: lipopolysaccharide biosynthesis protein [Calditrichaceae bacterium]